MAYVSLHAYDADVMVPGFLGLSQADVGMNPDTRYAAEEENLETPNGMLQPRAASVLLDGQFSSRIETLARFYRRWYSGEGSKYFLVAAAGGKLYQRQEGGSEWSQIQMPPGVASFLSNEWSFVTYEINFPGSEYAVDILIVSNDQDGMFIVVPSDIHRLWGVLTKLTWEDLKAQSWEGTFDPEWFMIPVDTKGNKFGVIERYAERIWGSKIVGEPDRLVYSAPYDPTNWEANTETPEDGAGEISLPSWDGNSLTALKAFGDGLIAFKEHRIWRITGVSPGEYAVNEQYGGGAPYPGTIVNDVERILMVETDGLSYYDGMSVSPYARKNVEQLWKRVNRSAMRGMCARMFKNRYYLALPVDGSAVNNALLIYDMNEGTILYHTGIYIESMLSTEENLYATSSNLPGTVSLIQYNSWDVGASCGEATEWVSPWMDFGRKNIRKGGFEVYFDPEVQDEAVTLRFSIQTEKKTKTKEYTVQPLASEQRRAGREHKFKRLRFSGAGRKVRFIIQTDAGVTAPWRLVGGLHIIAEIDPD